MTDYLTAAEMKQLLIEAITAQMRYARPRFHECPHDPGDPRTGRLSARCLVRGTTRLLRRMSALPHDDPRIIRLAELVPSRGLLLASLPDDVAAPADSIDLFLDSLVTFAVNAVGA